MAVKVSNLKIQLQNGTDNTYFATWSFSGTTKGSTATAIKAGSIVKIKSGATWYGGQPIPSSISSLRWYVLQISGDRAVLNKSPDNSGYAIMSPINTKYLTLSSGSSSSSDPVDRSTLDHYNVIWEYYTGNGGVWFRASESDVKINQATYSPPDNALSIRVKVKPVSTTHEVTNTVTSGTGKDATTKTVTTQVPNWSGTTVTAIYNIPSETSKPPEKPSAPSVEIKNTKLTATLEGITDVRADKIKFYVRKFNRTKNYKTCEVTVRNQRASFTCIVEAGYKYVVACKAINVWGSKNLFSKEYSDWTSPIGTSPKAPGAITTLKAKSETEVQITWGGQPTAETYDIEYTTEKRYFDKSSDQVKTTSTNKNIYSTYITGLEPGKEWFFRVRSKNTQGTSSWTAIKSIKLGKAPGAPTTWSSTTTATLGEYVTLYWIHNSEDGSSQTYAELELTINGVKTIKTIKNTTDEEKKDLTSSYSLSTIPSASFPYTEGTKILWRVRTKGVLNEYGDWSIQRAIDVYAKPTLELDVINKEGTTLDTIKSFPFYIKGTAGPSTQSAIGYHVEITANDSYETVDSMGNRKLIGKGDSVYSKYFDIAGELSVEMSANNIDLEDGISYSLTCIVSMNSGLTAEETLTFAVKWKDETYDVDASISIDPETFAAYIRPYCTTQKEVNITNTTTGETETVTDDVLVEGVTMSVYRREYNGEFTEIATGLDNIQNTVVTDPHPALDYARYRIVATKEDTGAISFYDPPGYPVNGSSVIIQWDEEWTSFDNFNIEETIAEPAWTGSMLKLPYNIDVSDKNNPDVSLVEYIGRKRPVTYYGTHIGETASWSVAIPKDDKETLYALRRLAIYMGDVYVREPSGSGYWANVKVSFSQTHCELTIPVTLDITRVEGGI